jgi:glutamate racemase
MVPAVKPAALSTRSGVIGVLATPAAARSVAAL